MNVAGEEIGDEAWVKRDEVMQQRHRQAPVWVTIQMGASLVPPLVSLFPSHGHSLPVSSGQPSAIVRCGGLARDSQSVPRRKSPRKQSKSSLRRASHYRIPNRNYEPWPAGYVHGEPRTDNRSPVNRFQRKIERRKARPTDANRTDESQSNICFSGDSPVFETKLY